METFMPLMRVLSIWSPLRCSDWSVWGQLWTGYFRSYVGDSPMEMLAQEWHDILWGHALQDIILGSLALAIMFDLLLVTGEECVGQRHLTGRHMLVALLLGTIGASTFVEFDGVREVVDLADLGQGLGDGLAFPMWHVADEEMNGEWVAINRIPCQSLVSIVKQDSKTHFS